jgi:hypothetical protein
MNIRKVEETLNEMFDFYSIKYGEQHDYQVVTTQTQSQVLSR